MIIIGYFANTTFVTIARPSLMSTRQPDIKIGHGLTNSLNTATLVQKPKGAEVTFRGGKIKRTTLHRLRFVSSSAALSIVQFR
jgi:hypothetical protein